MLTRSQQLIIIYATRYGRVAKQVSPLRIVETQVKEEQHFSVTLAVYNCYCDSVLFAFRFMTLAN
jgi:hypothetical protein